MRRKSWALVTAASALLAGVVFFLGIRPAQADSRWGANYFPNVTLITQDGKPVKFYDDLLKGKIVVIDLIYTHCVDSCPLETARLAQVQQMLGDRVGKDIFFYSITIDPDRDTPEELKAYAEKYHAGPGWLFLTGKKDEIDLISKKLGLYTEPDPNDRDGHVPSVLLGNEPAGQWLHNAATDNARLLSIMIGDWLNNWTGTKRGTSGKNYADAAPLNLDQGRYMFATQCAACHTVGHGDKIGPDLLGVTSVREREWLHQFILRPDKMLVEGDPLATALFKQYKQVQMPNLRLVNSDVDAIIGFLAKETAAAAAKGASEEHQHHHHSEQAPSATMAPAAATSPAMDMDEHQHHHHHDEAPAPSDDKPKTTSPAESPVGGKTGPANQ
jgi:protein SCO1/2